MENLKMSTEKLCSFYVSDWHLVTMILPYINREINEGANIITILENNIENNIKEMLSKLNLKNEKRILALDWKMTNGRKYVEVSNKIKSLVHSKESVNIVFINGSKGYIDSVNDNIDMVLKKLSSKIKNVKIKIIDCYEVTEFNGNIKEILDNHDKVLNTSGEKNIEDVFVGYSKISEVS